MNTLIYTLNGAIEWFCARFPADHFFSFRFNVIELVAIIMVALVCGAVGSLVVGNRMAFFSDALAHCAFAGMGLALLIALFSDFVAAHFQDSVLLIMMGFGVAVGLGIAWVQERTSLATDTVIGVFFAGAIGFGAMFMKAVSGRRRFINPETFLFGASLTIEIDQLVYLFVLLIVTVIFLVFIYNPLLFTTFNASLARSRRVRIRVCNYLFIAFLGVIINMCLHIVGVLLINALLVVPAATAANVSRNMRQMFWWSIGLCLLVGVLGKWLSWDVPIKDPTSLIPIHFGTGGTIVVLSVMLFFLSMVLGPWWRNRRAGAEASLNP
jgi:zinc transport system permease protein